MKQSIALGSPVVIRQDLDTFHYQETPVCSLLRTLKGLQKTKTAGKVQRVDSATGAVGVLFPHMKDFLWFKPYELQPKR